MEVAIDDGAVIRRANSRAERIAEEAECAHETCTATCCDPTGPRVLTEVHAREGESLAGLLARAAGANHLPRLQPLLDAATSVGHARHNLAARTDVNFAQLAYAARLDPNEIEERRYRPAEFAPTIPGVVFHGALVPAYDLRLRECRLAPSWPRSGLHCALGHHGLATHCPASGEVILEACPRCRTRLDWTHSTYWICHRCGCDVSRHAGEVVPKRILEATRPMLEIIHPDPERHRGALDRLHSSLRPLDRGLIFEIGWRMGCILAGRGTKERDVAKQLPTAIRTTILETGSQVLSGWPASVSEAFRGVVGTDAGRARQAVAVARQIAALANVWPDVRTAFHEALPELRHGPKRAVKASLERGANARDLEEELGVGQKVVDRLRATELRAVAETGEVNSHQLFDVAGLAPLRLLLADRIGVGAISERMNISRHGVEQLACLKLVELFDDGAISVAYRQRQARRSDYDGLLARLVERKIHLDRSESVRLHHAMRAIGGREKPWGPAISAMLSGAIPFALDEGAGRFLDRVRIRRADVADVAALRFDPARHPTFAFERRMNGRDTEELLNIFPKTTTLAVEDRSLPPAEGGMRDRDGMLALGRIHISAAEILARWNGADRRLPAPFRGPGRLAKTSALGWDRRAAELAMRELVELRCAITVPYPVVTEAVTL